MKFTATPLKGAYLIEPEPITDERGFFARSFCAEEFARRGLNPRVAQCSVSFNRSAGTLRGLHLQRPPHAEAKLVRCAQGRAHDVIVDLRRESPTYARWFAVELNAVNGTMLYVPEGLAHGFQTLVDNTEMWYQISEFHHPECADGVRWDDPLLGIRWPMPEPILSARDRAFANLDATP